MTVNIEALLADVVSAGAAADQALAAVAGEQAKVESARAKAAVAEAEHRHMVEQARQQATSRLYAMMRTLTDEVRSAREQAAEAVRTGQQPLEAWIAYRQLRARHRGTWEALRGELMHHAGTARTPRGDWGPDIVEQFRSDLAEQVPAEDFNTFVTGVMSQLETKTENDAVIAAQQQLAAQ